MTNVQAGPPLILELPLPLLHFPWVGGQEEDESLLPCGSGTGTSGIPEQGDPGLRTGGLPAETKQLQSHT